MKKVFKYKAIVHIESTVHADSEGDAGYQIDADLEALPGYVSHEIEIIEEDMTLDPRAQKFLDTIRIADNSIQLSDVKVEGSDKGNWIVYHNGKKLMIVNHNLLDDNTIRKYGLEYHR